MKHIWIAALGLAVVAVAAAQWRTISSLRAEVAGLRARVDSQVPAVAEDPPRVAIGRAVSLGTLPQRVTQLEDAVGQLAKTSELLAEHGITPPNASQLAQLQMKLADASASDGERMRALRALRRNGQATDEIAMQAMGWLEGATNAATRRDILDQLDGLTNAAMKAPLMALLSKETSGRVREELVDVLADFAADPAVEKKMWELALNDPEEDVRDEAADALTDGNMTPQRLASLTERASNIQLPLDERLLALRGLREGDKQPPEVIAEFSSLAQNSTDPLVRAKLFDAFDGIKDPALMSPLVHGLQDPNPVVRQNAADALSTFASDPRIQDWLKHVIQNDNDPRVKREAHQALNQGQRPRN